MWLGCRGPGGPLILGTLVPVEEPSTASKADMMDYSITSSGVTEVSQGNWVAHALTAKAGQPAG